MASCQFYEMDPFRLEFHLRPCGVRQRILMATAIITRSVPAGA